MSSPAKTAGRFWRHTDGHQDRLEEIKKTDQKIATPAKEALSKFTDSFADALRRRAQKKHAGKECNRNRGGERHVTP